MAKALDVYLHRDLVGKLVQRNDGGMVFDYAETWLSNPAAIPLSHSLPLSRKHFSRKECRPFFAGVLPEQTQREIIARNLGISARNDFAMLEQIGGECAGAVTFIPAGQSLPKREASYRPLTDPQLAEILKTLPRRPLLAGEAGIRLSLAGAQDKLAVHVAGDQISIPLNGAPSTHILKPAIERFPGLVLNEALCMNLARSVGLRTATVEIRRVESMSYLLVKRYDREFARDSAGGPEYLRRQHQEDFCQALGVVSEQKYQAEGGPSLKQCFELVRHASSTPVIDLQSLLDAVIFNFLIGNHDAHAKNFSLIYDVTNPVGSQTRLAPLYDLISTVYYPELSQNMAMKIGGEYLSSRITPTHFEKLAEEAGFAKPMVRRRVPETAEAVLLHLSNLAMDQPDTSAVATLIRGRCEGTIRRFTVR